MFKSALRLCVALLLVSLSVAGIAGDGGANPAIFVGPVFRIASISADDAGGIYNGSIVTISVIVHNGGAGAGQWQATLSIPNGYGFIDSNPCGGDFYSSVGRPAQAKSLNGTYLVWPHGTDGNGAGDSLGSGQSNTCNVRLSVTTATANDVATASVYTGPYDFGDGSLADTKTYTFNTTSSPTTDLAIAINSSSSSVSQGSSVDYTLTASNVGRQDATNAMAVFNFPTTLSVVPKTCPGAGTTGGQAITWAIGALTYGTHATCALTATARSGSGSNATVTASVADNGGTTDPNLSNNSASNTISITPPKTDIAAAITSSANSLMPGQTVTVTLKASNLSTTDAAMTKLTGNFPQQLQLNSVSCVAGTPSNPVVWNMGTLAAGASQSCIVQATLNATSVTTISVSDSASTATAESNAGNNSASVAIAVKPQTAIANVAISLASSAPGHTYTPGEVLSFIVTATNTSSGADASGVTATVHLPGDGSVDGFKATCGTVDSSGNLDWAIGALPRNSSVTCNVSATVVTSTHAIAVSASIDASALGNDLDNLMDDLLFPVSALPKLISVKPDGSPTTQASTHVALSQDGTTAVFESLETDLATNDQNSNGQDIYRVVGGQTIRENVDNSGNQLIGTASLPAVSGDGGVVAFAFTSSAATLAKDANIGQMWAGPSGQPKHQVDVGMDGAAPNGPVSGAPSVSSSNGSKLLVFCSAASNLVADDSNNARDVFMVDPIGATGVAPNPMEPTLLISTDASGQQLPGDSCEPALSADGTKVVFTISAPSLFGTNARQVVRKDLSTGALELISVSASTGQGANADSSEPTINADGSVVAFTSRASDLDSLGAPVGGMEAFVSLATNGSDATSRVIKRMRSGDGTVPNGASQHPQVSGDGTTVVMQTNATNFFGAAKAQGTPCGTVVVTTNFFTPAALGSSLCNGTSNNQNPTISGDGSTTGFDSNASQPGTTSGNSNAYTQAIAGLNGMGVSNFSDDLSGQWDDPNQSGQGVVIDVTNPDANNNRTMILTWFVFTGGEPTWVQGVGTPRAGSGTDAGSVVVQMDTVGIFHGTSFPLGAAPVTRSQWGSITLTFADASTGTMSWTSSYPGFNSGTMAITHFLPVGLPASDPPGERITACYSGNWYNPAQSGHGFEFEVIPATATTPRLLAVDWFAYAPNTGAPVWLVGTGPISGNGAQVQLALIDGAGAKFPPEFDRAQTTTHLWGTATFTFADSSHGQVAWNSTIAGYGSGEQPLQPTLGAGLLDRRGCQ